MDPLDQAIREAVAEHPECFPTGEVYTEVPEMYRMSAEEQARIRKKTQEYNSLSAAASLLSEYEASRFATD